HRTRWMDGRGILTDTLGVGEAIEPMGPISGTGAGRGSTQEARTCSQDRRMAFSRDVSEHLSNRDGIGKGDRDVCRHRYSPCFPELTDHTHLLTLKDLSSFLRSIERLPCIGALNTDLIHYGCSVPGCVNSASRSAR